MAAIAPMDLVKIEANSIPLLCSLCPRDPKFSDVSHLLTHISSKTHLSNRFHLELKSKQDARAKQRLDKYEDWYAQHGIENLLQARMNAKDQKKGIKRPRNGHTATRSNAASGTLYNDIKIDPEEASESHQPTLHHWHTVPLQVGHQAHGLGPSNAFEEQNEERILASGRGRRKKRSSENDPNRAFDDDAFVYPPPPDFRTPTNLRNRQRGADLETPDIQFRPSLSRSRSTSGSTGSLPASAKKKSGNAQGKLKGILWPGMAWFDSAPEEKKRMRNQRKDASVLKQMEANSASVEPNEQVWDLDGELQRTRDVYATPSVTGSPEPIDGDADEQRQRKPRKATNTVRGRKPAAQSKTAARTKRNGPTTKVVTRSASKKKAKLEVDSANENADEDATEDEASASSYIKQDTSSGLLETSPGPESPLAQKRLDPRRRTALQRLDSNQSLASPLPAPFKPRPLSYLNSGLPSFPSPAPRYHDYLGTEHGLPPGAQHPLGGLPNTLNPLWIQRNHPYHFGPPYMTPGFNNEMSDLRGSATAPTSSFQPINPPHGLGYHHYATLSRNQEYDGGEPAGSENY